MIVSALTRGLKSVAKGVGVGFKTLGSKISDILPGLIGSITGFISKTAGSVINFLGQNVWPPITESPYSWLSDSIKNADTSPVEINLTSTISSDNS